MACKLLQMNPVQRLQKSFPYTLAESTRYYLCEFSINEACRSISCLQKDGWIYKRKKKHAHEIIELFL